MSGAYGMAGVGHPGFRSPEPQIPRPYGASEWEGRVRWKEGVGLGVLEAVDFAFDAGDFQVVFFAEAVAALGVEG